MLDLVIYTSIKSAPEHLICLVLAASVTALTNRTYLRCQSGVKSFLKMLMYQKRTLRFFESFCLALTASKNGFYNLSVIQFDIVIDTDCGRPLAGDTPYLFLCSDIRLPTSDSFL